MRINEILTESQLQQLEEGPKLDAVGRGVGQAVGGFAKGVGALAGGVRGAFTALKKGYQSGKAIVGDDPDPNAGKPGYTAPADQTAPAPDPKVAPAPVADPKVAPAPVADPKVAPEPAPAPAPAPAPSTTTPPSAAEINAQGPEGSAPAKPQTGDAGKALAKSTAVVDKTQAQSQEKANQTVYAQVKANVDKLDKKGKQRILQLLQKSVAAPQPKSAADPAAAAAKRAGAKVAPGAGAFANMAKTLSQEPTKAAAAPAPAADPAAPAADPAATPAADPAAAGGKLTPAQQAAKVAELKGKRAAGKTTGTTGSGFGGYVKKASGERVVGANKDGSVRTVNIKASKNNYGNALSEALALRVEAHKQKMFETGLAQGTTSIFRK
jgi:hypothetical protein